MAEKSYKENEKKTGGQAMRESDPNVCPVCGSKLIQEKCKVICRSKTCVYRIIYNCSEF
jgi:hypothetical protein